MTRRARIGMFVAAFLVLPAHAALAWKIDTHLWLASKLVEELEASNCHVSIAPLGNQPVDRAVCDAIRNNRGAFLLGVLGADVYPDMVAGQFTTHPGVAPSDAAEAAARRILKNLGQTFIRPKRLWQTDDWLKWVRDAASSPEEVAFAHGYMIHAAMDMWAHTYVNIYSGDVFSLADEQEVEFRHMALESLVKHTHRSFLDSDPRAPGGSRAPGRSPLPVRRSGDALTPLTAPIGFVRTVLVLNPTVAAQYALQPATFHLWTFYTYWSTVKDLTQYVLPLVTAISDARRTLDLAVQQTDLAFRNAEAVYRQAKQAYDAAVTRYRELAAKMPSGDPQVQAAKAAMEAAQGTLDEAVEALAPLRLQREAHEAIMRVEREAQSLVRAPIDRWRRQIEQGIDAYILAWQDTSKELMRPHGTLLTAGSEPTVPLKQWAACWGATFGLPVPVSSTCSNALAEYRTLKTALETWLKDTLVSDPEVRKHIEALEQAVHRTGQDLVLASGEALSQHFADNGVVAGYARSIVNLRSRETPDANALNDEFDDNTSKKRLVTYTGAKIADLVYEDMGLGPNDPKHGLDLNDLSRFAALQNSVTMSRLTLLAGAQLNALITAGLPERRAVPTGATPATGLPLRNLLSPLYARDDKAGVVLIGALRNIDGDHQWQKFAPPLPPAAGLPAIDDATAARLGSRGAIGGRAATVPRPCRMFGYDMTDGGGLRLWQDPLARRVVFNRIFQAPLTPGLVSHWQRLEIPRLAQGLVPTADEPFPPSNAASGCAGTR